MAAHVLLLFFSVGTEKTEAFEDTTKLVILRHFMYAILWKVS